MEGITSIEDGAFGSCDFTTIELPSSVIRIEKNAFSSSTNLTEIVVRGKSSLSEFTDATGLTTGGGLPEGVNIIFRP